MFLNVIDFKGVRAADRKKPDGLFVIQPEDVDSFLSPLSVGRLPGVGKVTEEKLKGFDVQTIADLRRMDLPTFEDRLGRYKFRAPDIPLKSGQIGFFRKWGADLKLSAF
jgi:nucleotidyltransferase/DNA polymerase involved in DNA repair